MAMKKRGFGMGKWNGVGGKPRENEDIKSAAIRELEEEIKVNADINDLREVGRIKFYFKGKPEWDQDMHIFLVDNFKGEPQESEEMAPKWYGYQEIPFGQMWWDDPYWLPLILKGKRVEGEFHFDSAGNKCERFNVREV